MANDTFIKIWRKIEDSQVFKDSELFHLFIFCLLRATHKETMWEPVVVGRGKIQVELHRGQMVFGRYVSANKIGQNPISTYRRLQKLEKMGILNIKSNSKYTIVTICNYDYYQSDRPLDEQQSEPPMNSQCTANEQPMNTFNNISSSIFNNNTSGSNGNEEKQTPKRRAKQASKICWTPELLWQGIEATDKELWKQAYPACDIDRQLTAMSAWLKANPVKAHKKTWERFITNWLNRSQERGGDAKTNLFQPQPQKSIAEQVAEARRKDEELYGAAK